MNEMKKAIEYFENAIRETDEVIEECSQRMKDELFDQKEHFTVGLAALREKLERDNGCGCPCGEPGPNFCEKCNKIRVEAIREKLERNNPKPLTLDELKERAGKPVWIRELYGSPELLRFDRFEPATYHSGDDARFDQFGTTRGIIRWLCKYGETWLAYDHEPKERKK